MSVAGGVGRLTRGAAATKAGALDRRPVAPEVRHRRTLNSVANHAILLALSAMFLLPLLFVLLTSLMTDQQALTPNLWPAPFQPSNYVDVFEVSAMATYVRNSILIAVLSTVGIVVSTVPVAYALSRLQWRGRQAAFIVILATLMLPFQVTVVPLYVLFVRYGWIPSFYPLIVPSFFGDAFSIFLLRQFFMSIPEELTDAARVDGAGEWQIMTRVIVPLAKPAIAAVALFHFLWAWNDFFGPLLYLIDSQELWTVTIGLSEFETLHHVEWNLMMAASVLFMLPVIIMFFLAQKVFIEGVTLTGVKG
jgi:multiple sugar transport system permease protein